MNRLSTVFVAALLAAGMQSISAQQNAAQAEKLFANGQRKASVDGDLKGAIEEYKKVVAAAGSNRALAAQALLRMAECHQKLGDAQAQEIYQRLVRDYADQKDAAILARARLTITAAPSGVLGDRSVWSGQDADGFGTISPDGRFLTYTDWKNGGHLALRDLTSGTNHRLTSDGSTQFSAMSKDGKQVAYQWWDSRSQPNARRHELRVARLHPTSISEPRALLRNDDVVEVAPYDWSPDNKWIAVSLRRVDRTIQIGLVAAQDGSLRVLKSLEDWKEPTKIFFSPDGKYVAYDVMPGDNSSERHVFVMAVDASREAAVVAHQSHNAIMGWSPDGRYVLFASDRSGSVGLWAVPVQDGKPAATAVLVKADVASSWSLGLTASGTMYVWKYASPIYVQTSSVDLASGTLTTPAAGFQRFISSRGRPDWSDDGKKLAFQSCDSLGAGPCTLWIRSMETGQLRELKVPLGYFFFPRWSPNGRELLVRGRDPKGRNNGLYRIDAQTGDTTLVVTPFQANGNPQWAPDGEHIYYPRGSSMIERDLASGAEREIVQIPTPRPVGATVSPDGRSVAYWAQEASTQTLFIVNVSGGGPRSLLSVNSPEQLIRFDWTSGGASVVAATQRTDTLRNELWLVGVNGEKPRKLDIDINHWLIEDGFRFDRAGKQVAFVAAAGQPGLEIRALENFLPR